MLTQWNIWGPVKGTHLRLLGPAYMAVSSLGPCLSDSIHLQIPEPLPLFPSTQRDAFCLSSTSLCLSLENAPRGQPGWIWSTSHIFPSLKDPNPKCLKTGASYIVSSSFIFLWQESVSIAITMPCLEASDKLLDNYIQ